MATPAALIERDPGARSGREPSVKMTSAPGAQPPPKQEAPPVVFRERKLALDSVKEDGVMKELVRNQEKAVSNWKERWGFLENPRRLWEEEAVKRGLPPDIFERVDNRRKPAKWSESRRPTMKLPPCTPLPKLSSAMIGWRSSIKENNLNLLAGPLYVSPVRTMNPPLPPGLPDPRYQRFIFLG